MIILITFSKSPQMFSIQECLGFKKQTNNKKKLGIKCSRPIYFRLQGWF